MSFILTGYAGFTTSAGYVGPNFRVDHDISLLVPEIWCRMRVQERDPEFLKANGCLENVSDFCLDGRTVLASRLGYRITPLFAERFLGRIFETPAAVFTEEMLRPEKQDIVQFAAGVDAIVEAQARVARQYFEDGSVVAACPPLKALLHIMANGSYQGKGVEDAEVRGLFTREYLMESDWYGERLHTKQARDIALDAPRERTRAIPGGRVTCEAWISTAGWPKLAGNGAVSGHGYLKELTGTIGADPFFGTIQE